MALKPNLDPKWSTDNNPLDNVEPDTTYKEKGIAAGSTWTRQWLNWMFYSISQWIDWVRSYAMDKDQNLNDLVDKPTARTNLGLNDPANTLGANIQTANKWKTARTLSLTGHITGSVSVDGSSDASLSTTLANSGVAAGTYPKVTVDVKGRVTAGSSLVASDIPSLDASKITSGTLTLNTTGNAATATYATSAGSAPWSGITDKPDIIAAGSTQRAAREAVGIGNAMIADQASISASGDTGYVTTSHLRQVNASENSRSFGFYSQVNASIDATAVGVYSQINASYNATASESYSQINASYTSATSGLYSQVNCSVRVTNQTVNSSAWGYADSGSASTANQKIRLESNTGVGRFKGNTTTGGFDYAEYFPHLNNGVIPDGTIVTLVGEKITPAQAGDFILGTVSSTAGVIGNAPEFCWSGRFLKDEFGRELKQEADLVRWQSGGDFYDGLVSECDKPIPSDAEYYTQEIPITNPDYVDISSDYKPRGDRAEEWSVIGLMGQVYVRVYEDIEHNTYVGADGKQSDTETRIYCMKMTTPFSSEKGYGVAFCLLR